MQISDRERALFPEYDVLEVTEGGLGRVYYLKDRATRDRAIAKTLRWELMGHPRHYKRFLQEAQIAMVAERSPFLNEPIALITEHEQPYLLMHWVDGWTLEAWAKRSTGETIAKPQRTGDFQWSHWWKVWHQSEDHPFHPAALLYLIWGLTHGLEALYKSGVSAHGDIHGRNIMVQRGSFPGPVLIDLGLAKAAFLAEDDTIDLIGEDQRHELAGCLPYLAPELLSGQTEPNFTTDIYALGVTIYLLLMGHHPYKFSLPLRNSQTLRDNVTKNALPLPDPILTGVSETYSRLVLKCLARDPGNRFQTVQELRQALCRVLYDDYRLTVRVQTEAMTESQMLEHEEGLLNRALSFSEAATASGGKAEHEKVIDICKRMLLRNPRNVRALQVFAQTLYELDRFSEADPMIQQAEAIEPNNYHVLNTRGIIEMAQGRYEVATVVLQRAVEVSANSSQKAIALANLSKAQRLSGEIDSAQRTIRESLATGGSLTPLLEHARLAYDSDNIGELKRATALILQFDTLNAKVWGYLGYAFLREGKWHDAYVALKTGLSIDPNNADMLVDMAYAAAEDGASKAEILGLLDRAQAAGRDDAAVNALRAAASDGQERQKYARLALQQDPSNTFAQSMLNRTSAVERTDEREFRFDTSVLEERGFARDAIGASLEALVRTVMSVHNTGISLSRKTVQQFLDGLDPAIVIAVCDHLGGAMMTSSDPQIQAIAKSFVLLRDELGRWLQG